LVVVAVAAVATVEFGGAIFARLWRTLGGDGDADD